MKLIKNPEWYKWNDEYTTIIAFPISVKVKKILDTINYAITYCDGVFELIDNEKYIVFRAVVKSRYKEHFAKDILKSRGSFCKLTKVEQVYYDIIKTLL